MKFTKMQGLGNDYIYLNCMERAPEDPSALSVLLSRPHFGVGSDGLVLILPSDKADFRMRMFNADGSEGKMCGNASRCIGKYVYERRLTGKTDLTLETLSGIRTLHLSVRDGKVEQVSVGMGAAQVTAVGDVLNAAGKDWRYTSVSVGNPHCVIFCKNVEEMDIASPGRLIENHPNFPGRTNVEFAQVLDPSHIRMRVWERGSGETLACGTGACATAAAAAANGLCGKDVTVLLRGGPLQIQLGEEITMTGPAAFVFDGEFREEDLYAENQ